MTSPSAPAHPNRPFALETAGDVHDGPIEFEATAVRAEAAGYDGLGAVSQHDPFLALPSPAARPRRRLGTSIAVAFARDPMTMAVLANDLQLLSGGRFILGLGSQIEPHIERRFSMPWSQPAARMREFVLRCARSGRLADRREARLPRRLLHALPDDAALQPRPEPVRHPPV